MKTENQPDVTDRLNCPSAVRSSDLLAGFTAMQQLCIVEQLKKTPPEKLNTVSEGEWRRYRGAGDQFIMKLIQRGMIGELWDRRKRQPLSPAEKAENRRLARVAAIDDMIAAAEEKIKRLKQERRTIAR